MTNEEKLLKLIRQYGVAMWDLGCNQDLCTVDDKAYYVILTKADKAYEAVEEFLKDDK